MKQFYLFLFLVLVPVLISAQTNTDFWFAGPEISAGHADSPIYLRLTSFNQNADVSISEPANTAGFPTQNLVIAANSTVTVDLTPWKEIIESKPPNTVLNYGLYIHSTVPITAYYEEASTLNPEIFTLKGNNALGTSFYIPSQDTLYNHGGLVPPAYNSFDIVATTDATTVTIKPSHDIVGHSAKSTFTVTLNKGQVYSAQATGQQGMYHLMGSGVTSDHAVAITVKDDSDQFPGTSNYDLTGDQIVPTNIIGEQYIVVRGYSNAAMNDWVFITAITDNTNISLNGVYTANINTGDTYRYRMVLTDSSSYIEASHPVYVWHLTGYGAEAGSAILPPMNCTGSSQVAFTRTTQYSFELIILTKTGAQGSFTMDGNPAIVTAAMFHTVSANPNFMFARIDFPVATLPVGAHILANSQDIFHMGVIHTYNSGQSGCSYGYFTDFASLNLGPDLTVCPGTNVTFDAGPNRNSYSWSYNGVPYLTGVQTITVSNPGQYSVIVDDHSCLLYDTVQLINYPVTSPVITGVTGFCEGSSQQLGVQGTYPSYLWTTGATTQSITVTASGTYSVSVTDSHGCQANGSVTVTVGPLPTATISGGTQVCQNAASPPVTFTGASGSSPYTFTYNINGGASQVITTTFGNSATVAASTSLTGIFTYNLVSVQEGSPLACSQALAGSTTVMVAPLPAATISGTTTVCLNASAPLVIFTGTSASPPFTFTYNINGGPDLNATTTGGNSVSVAAPSNVAGVFTYNLLGVQDGSPLACSQAQPGSAIVTVNPLPAAAISGTTTVCRNSTPPQITFTGTSGTAPYTFVYTINGGSNLSVATTVGNSVTVNVPTATAGTYAYNLVSVQESSSLACSQAQTGTATVTVLPLPTAGIAGTTSVCLNATAPLITFTGASSSAPYTFTYKINGGADQAVITTLGNTVTVTAPTSVTGTFAYSLVSVTDGSAKACSQAQNGTATITVNPFPTATISGTTTVCQDAASPLVLFSGASATAPYTFTYTLNGGPVQTVTTTSGNSATIAAPTSIAGTLIYTLLSVQDGSSTACSQSQGGSVVITVKPLPSVSLTACNDPKTTTTSRPFTLKGGSPPGGTWYIDGVAAAGGLFNPSVLSISTHQVTYSYTNVNTCKNTSSSVPVVVLTGSAPGSCPLNFTDPRDNTTYKSFRLGNHCWMLANLDYGTGMASVGQPQGDNCIPEKYCLPADPTCTTYGGLYQWDELMQYQVPASGLTLQGLCPPEWHIPTQAEWQDLIDGVSTLSPGDGLAGSFLKDTVSIHSFHGLPDGIFYLNNTWAFTSGNLTGTMFWTATNNGAYMAVARGMNVYNFSTSYYPSLRANAFPVRCVKD